MSDFLTDAREFLPILLSGVWVTIAITACALVVSVILGFVWAMLGASRFAALRTLSRVLINTVRGIPILVQLFYIYFVLPQMGITLNAFLAGVAGLGLAYSVYQAENFRAGFASVDRSLIETAESLGMPHSLIVRRLILPLAVRVILPPFGNTSIMLLKDSSIASTITVAELTRQGQLLAVSTFKNMTVYTIVALLYLAMSLPLSYLTRRLERRFAAR
ncbi:MAG TPA: amino acid ABC transporter permease [Bryobacteraceae bacterium]|nr:amino acid ABC transporter permease [Bryobacteraceae bacterium]